MSELATFAQNLELPILADENSKSLQFILVYGMNGETGSKNKNIKKK